MNMQKFGMVDSLGVDNAAKKAKVLIWRLMLMILIQLVDIMNGHQHIYFSLDAESALNQPLI